MPPRTGLDRDPALGPRRATGRPTGRAAGVPWLGRERSQPPHHSQQSQPDIHFTAHRATEPTRATWYFAWRLGLWRGNCGWALDHTHHKIYLTNFPPEVQAFRISNGFNIVTLSRTVRRGPFSYSFGAGPVVAYPISTVRDKKLTHDRGVGGMSWEGVA